MTKKGKYIPCAMCGRDVYVMPFELSKKKYCSKECLGKANGDRRRGKPAPWIGEPKQSRTCVICGKTFSVPAAWLKKDRNAGTCCSRPCADKWHSVALTGKKASNETRAKIAAAKRGRPRPDIKAQWDAYYKLPEHQRPPASVSGLAPVAKPLFQCAYCGIDFIGKISWQYKNQWHFCCPEHEREWRAVHYAGVGNPMRGVSISGPAHSNWKGGPVEITCVQCGRQTKRSRYRVRATERQFCSEACYHAWCSGPNNYAWNGGTAFEPWGPEFTKALRERVRERDGFSCRLCGAPQDGKKLSVHHVDYDKHNNNIDNLVALCNRCHVKTNSSRDNWQRYFILAMPLEVQETLWTASQ